MSSFGKGRLGSGFQMPVTAVPGFCPSNVRQDTHAAFPSDGSSGGFLDGDFGSGLPGMPNVTSPQMDLKTFEFMRSIGYLDKYMQLCNAYFAALQSTSRCASSVASSAASISSTSQVSGKPASLKPNGFKAARDKLFTAVGARRKSEGVHKVFKSVEDYGPGFCYLHAFSSASREKLANALGSWPTISKLLALSDVPDLIPVEQLRSLGVEYSGDNVHVVDQPRSSSFYSMLASMRTLVGYSDGILSVVGGSEAYDEVHMACRIGGAALSKAFEGVATEKLTRSLPDVIVPVTSRDAFAHPKMLGINRGYHAQYTTTDVITDGDLLKVQLTIPAMDEKPYTALVFNSEFCDVTSVKVDGVRHYVDPKFTTWFLSRGDLSFELTVTGSRWFVGVNVFHYSHDMVEPLFTGPKVLTAMSKLVI